MQLVPSKNIMTGGIAGIIDECEWTWAKQPFRSSKLTQTWKLNDGASVWSPRLDDPHSIATTLPDTLQLSSFCLPLLPK